METERLIIRRFTPDDWEDLYEYLSDEKVVRYEPYPPFSEDKCREEAVRRSDSEDFWAVCLKGNGKLIGNLYFHHNEPKEFMTWEIGYVFNRAYHGNGYASESAARMLKYGFEELRAHRIEAYCDPLNHASWKLLERIGMRREAHFLEKAFFKTDSGGNPLWHDAYGYAVLAREWGK